MQITKLKTSDPVNADDANAIQQHIMDAVNPSLKKQILNGTLTDSVALTTSFQNVAHKLGRAIVGWIPVSLDADARIWQDAVASNPDASRFIRVRASAAVNCKFWVF